LELSIMIGTRAISGSAAMRFRNFVQRLVDVDIEDVRPVLDLLARDSERGVPVAALDGLGEFWRAGDVGAFTDDQKAGGVAWDHGDVAV